MEDVNCAKMIDWPLYGDSQLSSQVVHTFRAQYKQANWNATLMSANPYVQNDWQAEKCSDWLMYSDSVVPFTQRQVWSLRTTISVIPVRQYRDISFCLTVTWHMKSTWHMILSGIWLQDTRKDRHMCLWHSGLLLTVVGQIKCY